MSKIVVLDGYALNPGDLSWETLENLGDCSIYERTPPELVVERAEGAEYILVNKVVMSREVMKQLPELKYIGVLATGYNIVDVKAAAEMNITVTNVPEYGTTSVAQMVFSHILNLCQHVGAHYDAVKNGKWSNSPDFCFWDYPLIELQGQTIGIVGYGRIGRATALIAQAFEMNVIVYTRHPSNEIGVEFVALDDLFEWSDFVSLHCPLTADNEKFVNKDMLRLMKPTACLINTGRGQLIDEADLAEALNTGVIAGAGLDVLSIEPPDASNPLLSAKNCYITPHIAWATKAARERLMQTAVNNLKEFIAESPQNVVS